MLQCTAHDFRRILDWLPRTGSEITKHSETLGEMHHTYTKTENGGLYAPKGDGARSGESEREVVVYISRSKIK